MWKNIYSATGQSTTEFVLMLTFLTALGLLIMQKFTGPNGHGGATATIGTNAANAIRNDDN